MGRVFGKEGKRKAEGKKRGDDEGTHHQKKRKLHSSATTEWRTSNFYRFYGGFQANFKIKEKEGGKWSTAGLAKRPNRPGGSTRKGGDAREGGIQRERGGQKGATFPWVESKNILCRPRTGNRTLSGW